MKGHSKPVTFYYQKNNTLSKIDAELNAITPARIIAVTLTNVFLFISILLKSLLHPLK